MIAGSLLVLNVFQTWLHQMTKLKLREGLVLDLLGQWLAPRRAFRLANAGPIGVNPDQRLHEDARHLTELSADLGIGLFQATILLLSFIGVLWTLSSASSSISAGALSISRAIWSGRRSSMPDPPHCSATGSVGH